MIILNGRDIVILGVDLMPMSSPESSAQPKYSIAIFSNGKIISRMEEVSKRRLLNLIWKIKPNFLAIDNIYELAPTIGKLLKFISMLPSNVKLVQVTGSPKTGFKSLSQLAYQHRLISHSQKLSPMQSAEVAARLASKGIGFIVSPSKGEVRIIVCRRRRPGEGGMSEDRFKRKIRTSILRVAREIKCILDSNEFDYDIFFRKSRYGLENCLFIVYASYDLVRQLVKNVKEGDVQVKVMLKPSSKLSFTPLSGEYSIDTSFREYLIVGVDPGMVTGVAVLNVYGELITVFSKRHLSRGDLISILMEYGNPILIASDVHPPPSFIEKLASMLHASIYTPLRNLTFEEKQEILKKYFDEFKPNINVSLDSHKRDALAAAIKAFMHYRNKFEQAEAHARELGAKISFRKLRALIVQGHSIRNAIEILRSEGLKEVKEIPIKYETVKPERKVDKKIICELREKLKIERQKVQSLISQRDQLLTKIKELENKIRELEDVIRFLQSEIAIKLRKEREIVSLKSRITSLKTSIDKLSREKNELEKKINNWKKVIYKLVRGEIIVLKPIKNLTKDDVLKGISLMNISKDDAVYVKDLSTADTTAIKKLSQIKIKCIIGKSEPPLHVKHLLKKYAIPFINQNELEIVWIDDLPFADLQLLNRISREIKERLTHIIEEEERARIQELFMKYRKERIEELKRSQSHLEELIE